MAQFEPTASARDPPSADSDATYASAGRASQETGTTVKNDTVKPATAVDEPEKTGAKTWLVLVSVFLATFLIALDRSIISTVLFT